MPKDLKLYQILNVDATATDAEITAAYNRLIAEHPESDPRHEEIVHAYSVLSDVERRAKYDVTGKTTRIRRSRKTASGTKLEKVRFGDGGRVTVARQHTLCTRDFVTYVVGGGLKIDRQLKLYRYAAAAILTDR
jgi:DnaJ-class molecular chaperone